jgi:hypothetical protein
MLMMIVQHQTFVIKEAVLMHVDYLIVDLTLYAKLVSIQQNAFVYLVLQEMLELHVIDVS